MKDPDTPPDNDRLSGWKEIANHVRRSVRSVQRWEEELGLPVRRRATLRGQAVFASRAELDAWMARTDVPSESVDSVHADPAALSTPPDSSVAAGGSPAMPRWYFVAALIIVALLGAWIGHWRSTTSDLVHSSIRVVHRQVEAVSPTGEVLWRHPLHADVGTLPDHGLLAPSSGTHSLSNIDLNDDGEIDRLVPVRYDSRAGEPAVSDKLFAFSASGQLMWTLDVPDSLRCGGQTFSAPWRIRAVIVSSDEGPRRVWVSFVHHTWWPSFVMEVAPDGRQEMRYVQPGWIMSLAEWQQGDRRYVAAGGVLNEQERASLVLFDPEQPLSVFPAVSSQFDCGSAGGQPAVAWAFPPLEIATAYRQPYVMVNHVNRVGQSLRLDIASHAHVTIDARGEITEFTFTDSYRKEHHLPTVELLVGHSASQCAEMTSPKDVLSWSPREGWRSTPFANPSGSPPR